ncbi:hypothetical protein [Streptosporangium sp. KLBMP 9127]|nr:hypothetical protein [Streptosporangium sp. KLBMP 9127]
MSEYTWPDEGPAFGKRVRDAWAATCRAVPIGTRVTGTVIGRQPFGILLRIAGVPNAIGLAEIIGMPLDCKLPELGAVVAGEVISHAEHNHQVRIRMVARRRSGVMTRDVRTTRVRYLRASPMLAENHPERC